MSTKLQEKKGSSVINRMDEVEPWRAENDDEIAMSCKVRLAKEVLALMKSLPSWQAKRQLRK